MAATHPVLQPTWYGEIRDMFTSSDIEHMGSQGLNLTDYITVKNNAPNIYGQVAAGNMPPAAPWTQDEVQTFLNWMTTDYPKGTVTSSIENIETLRNERTVASRVRKEITTLNSDELNLLKTAFAAIISKDINDPNSYFVQAAAHGLPGRFCMHHAPGYNPWHRAHLFRFENALRSIPGCENVTLPFWDIRTPLPDVFDQEPFRSYTLPQDVGGPFNRGYITQRSTAAEIIQQLGEYKVLEDLDRAATKTDWEDFHGYIDGRQNNTTISAHDGGHVSIGPTMGQQEVAAFDPIFWFYHCNLDRLWWEWQKSMRATNVTGLLTTIESQGSRNIFTVPVLQNLPPFTAEPPNLNTLSIVDSETQLNVDYQTPPIARLMTEIAKTKGSTSASDPFFVHAERANVRVKGINRLKIPGSFKVHLLKDNKVIASKAFFQPIEVEKCENCVENAVVHFDFNLPVNEVNNGKLGVWVEPLDHSKFGDKFPQKMMGNPTVNVRLLLSNE